MRLDVATVTIPRFLLQLPTPSDSNDLLFAESTLAHGPAPGQGGPF